MQKVGGPVPARPVRWLRPCCCPIGLFLIGLDRRITHWAGRPNLGCFKKNKSRPISCFFLRFYLSHIILICSSSKYHSKIMCSAVINSFFLNATLLVHFNRDLSINLPSFMLVRCDDSCVIGFGAVKGKI